MTRSMTRARGFFHPYPKYLQIGDLLRKRIVTRMKPGDRLPTEVELSRDFGVSRETLRQALGPLESEGLISRTRGRGSFVASRPAARPSRKLTGMMEDFESLGAKTHIRVMQHAFLDADTEAADYLQLAADTPVVRIDRLRYFDNEALSYHVAFLPLPVGARVVEADLARKSIVVVLRTLGLVVGEDRREVEADTADVRLAQHLEVAIGSPVLVVRRVYVTRPERPVVYFRAYFRADRYMYTVKLRQPAAVAPARRPRGTKR